MKSIVLIGSGNVATRLALALHKTDYQILQIYNHHIGSAKVLAKKLGCTVTSSLAKLMPADLYIIAIKDDAIESLATHLSQLQIIPKQAIVVHTSGSQSSTLLEKCASNYGVLYPLQTLKKNVAIDFFNVPFAVLGNTPANRKKLHQLARNISKKTIVVNDKQRLALHVAAVFANNFTHHLLVNAQQICATNHLQWELLQPLIERTFIQAKEKNLADLQTGPAIRNDKKTIASHVAQLKANPKAALLYKVITKSIQESNH
jgi:predicted short-subunit dehydrogenase-like oxidoreductase (DUF2520 family)